MLVWLIRHAESVANSGGVTADPATIALTERGSAQAVRLATALPRPPALIVTSSYTRTQLTAQPTIERFAGVPHREWRVEEFTYLHRLHGRPTTAAERRPMVEEYWRRADPHHVDGPGAESFAALLDRARGFLRQVRGCPDEPVAVFTHGIFIRAVLWARLAGPAAPTAAGMRLFRSFATAVTLPNTAVVELRFDARGAGSVRYAGVGHLPDHLVTGG